MCHQLLRNISVTLTKRHCVARTAATIMAKSGDSCENGAHSALYKRKLGYFFVLQGVDETTYTSCRTLTHAHTPTVFPFNRVTCTECVCIFRSVL